MLPQYDCDQAHITCKVAAHVETRIGTGKATKQHLLCSLSITCTIQIRPYMITSSLELVSVCTGRVQIQVYQLTVSSTVIVECGASKAACHVT